MGRGNSGKRVPENRYKMSDWFCVVDLDKMYLPEEVSLIIFSYVCLMTWWKFLVPVKVSTACQEKITFLWKKLNTQRRYLRTSPG